MALAGLLLGSIASVLGALGIVIIATFLHNYTERREDLAEAAAFFRDPQGSLEIAKQTAAEAKLHEISAKLDYYRVLGGSYPTNDQGLEALVTIPSSGPRPRTWQQQFASIPVDPWGEPYVYTTTEDGYTVASMGPDQAIGTQDDVVLDPRE